MGPQYRGPWGHVAFVEGTVSSQCFRHDLVRMSAVALPGVHLIHRSLQVLLLSRRACLVTLVIAAVRLAMWRRLEGAAACCTATSACGGVGRRGSRQATSLFTAAAPDVCN